MDDQPFFLLFIHQLRLLDSAESQVLLEYPKWAREAGNKEVKGMLEYLTKETQTHKQRLEQAFKTLNESKKTQIKSPAMNGLIAESKEINAEDISSSVKDAAIVGTLQKIEFYFIASYNTVKSFAHHLKLTELESLFQESLDDKKKAIESLTAISEGSFFWKGVTIKAADEEME